MHFIFTSCKSNILFPMSNDFSAKIRYWGQLEGHSCSLTGQKSSFLSLVACVWHGLVHLVYLVVLAVATTSAATILALAVAPHTT